ncbi:transposase [Streptomyces roseoverticillatus]|uniref:transposase n=1 Tax=Streptomyces roseoverticillatus TaxID=66429 RepID=UPI0033C43945
MHVLSDASGLPPPRPPYRRQHPRQPRPKTRNHGQPDETRPPRGRHFNPRRLHADKTCDYPRLRRWLRDKRIGVRIARRGIESSERLGRRRWVIEPTMSWLTNYRRLNHRYERHPRNYLAFLGPGAAIFCYKRLILLTT